MKPRSFIIRRRSGLTKHKIMALDPKGGIP
jgi:hypothetical protein